MRYSTVSLSHRSEFFLSRNVSLLMLWLPLCPPSSHLNNPIDWHHSNEALPLNHTLSYRNCVWGYGVYFMEVRCPHPCMEASGFNIQVSSPSYCSPLLGKKLADTRGSGYSAICRPHQSPEWEFWIKVSWRGETPSTVSRQILTLTEGWTCRLSRKPSAAGASRPVEAIVRDGQVD